jgi:Flp pilus assembly protein TadG
MVELALLMPVLMVILLGIVEFSLILNDQCLLMRGAMEGARTAALEGRALAEVKNTTVQSARPTVVDLSAIQVECSTDPSRTDWRAVADKPDNTGIDVPKDAMVRVSIAGYRHTMVTGRFFALLPGCADGTFQMSAFAVRRRE